MKNDPNVMAEAVAACIAPNSRYGNELQTAVRIACGAAQIIMPYFEDRSFSVEHKADDMGPVTSADKAANTYIVEQLIEAFPGDKVIAEESDAAERSERTWYVDPIDGTKRFVAGEDEFCVMIGLVVSDVSVLGVVLQPTNGRICVATSEGAAWEITPGDGGLSHQKMQSNQIDTLAEARVIRSRSHRRPRVGRLIERHKLTQSSMGSMGLKICEIAAGRAEAYMSLTEGACVWDAAAGQAILLAAGGKMTKESGAPIRYDEAIHLKGGVVMTNGAVHQRLLDAIAAEPKDPAAASSS